MNEIIKIDNENWRIIYDNLSGKPIQFKKVCTGNNCYLTYDAIDYIPIRETTWRETRNYFYSDGLMMQEMVQHYPEYAPDYEFQAKLWQDLQEVPRYQTSVIIVPGHPAEHTMDSRLLIGEVRNLRADSKAKGVLGRHYLYKDKIMDRYPILVDKLRKNEPIKESVGFFNSQGPAGILDGKKYHASQQNILLFHLGLLFKDEVPRCSTCQTPFTDAKTCPTCNDNKKINVCETFLKNEKYKKQTIMENLKNKV